MAHEAFRHPPTGTGTPDPDQCVFDVGSNVLAPGVVDIDPSTGEPYPDGRPVDVKEAVSAAEADTWTSADAVDSEVVLDTTLFPTARWVMTFDGGNCSVGEVRLEGSDDGGATWTFLEGELVWMGIGGVLGLVNFDSFATTISELVDARGYNRVRLRLNPAITGAISVSIRLFGVSTPFSQRALQRILLVNQADGTAMEIVSGKATTTPYGFDGTTYRRLKVDPNGELQVDVLALPAITGSVTANAGTNLNTSALATEAGGNLEAQTTALQIIDDWDESDRAKVNPIAGQAGVQGGSGTVNALTQRMVLATDVALPAGTNAIGKLAANDGVDIGDVDVGSMPADPFGVNADAASATGSHSAKLRKIAELPNAIRVTATPTISAAAYANNEQFGTVMTFANMGLANGGAGKIVNAILTNRDTDAPVLELWLFRVSPTMVGSDNNAFDLTDANLEAGEIVGIIDFLAWQNTASGQVSIGQIRGQGLGGSPLEYICGSSATSLFGIMVVRATPTPASTADVVVSLFAHRYS